MAKIIIKFGKKKITVEGPLARLIAQSGLADATLTDKKGCKLIETKRR